MRTQVGRHPERHHERLPQPLLRRPPRPQDGVGQQRAVPVRRVPLQDLADVLVAEHVAVRVGAQPVDADVLPQRAQPDGEGRRRVAHPDPALLVHVERGCLPPASGIVVTGQRFPLELVLRRAGVQAEVVHLRVGGDGREQPDQRVGLVEVVVLAEPHDVVVGPPAAHRLVQRRQVGPRHAQAGEVDDPSGPSHERQHVLVRRSVVDEDELRVDPLGRPEQGEQADQLAVVGRPVLPVLAPVGAVEDVQLHTGPPLVAGAAGPSSPAAPPRAAVGPRGATRRCRRSLRARKGFSTSR